MVETRPVSLKTIDDTFTVDEFLIWAAQQPEGRFELHLGRVVQMAPERNIHALTKGEAYAALRSAVLAARAPCTVFPDGATVRTASGEAYEPDAAVQCGGRFDPNSVEIAEPVIVVEVLSPSTRGLDSSAKLVGYFGLPSVEHVLLIDPDRKVVIHHRRDAPIAILGDGELRLDPPGLALAVADLFPTLPPREDASDEP